MPSHGAAVVPYSFTLVRTCAPPRRGSGAAVPIGCIRLWFAAQSSAHVFSMGFRAKRHISPLHGVVVRGVVVARVVAVITCFVDGLILLMFIVNF